MMPAKGSIDWIRQLYEGLPESLKPFGMWPIAVADAVEDELRGVEGAVPRVSILRRKEGLSRDIVWSGCEREV